jgi:hypothetical protein
MLSIYTYPNNSGTGYIDPDYYGSTTGGSETGYYKRILDLKDGTYKTWVTGQTAPVDTVSDLITATGKFHKGVRTENGLENIMIYSYYNQPLITIDSVLINEDISASDTDATPAARLTVSDSSDFVDGDNVLLTGFDGTLAELNGLTRYADVIDSTTVDLYHDSGLTDPVEYVPAITGHPVAAINTLGEYPLTQPVRTTLTNLYSSYNESETDFNTYVGASDEVVRLNSFNTSFIDNAVSDTFEVWQTLTTDALTVDEFLNDDYTKDWASGSLGTISAITNSSDEYFVSQLGTYTNYKIWKIQKKLSTGAWENGANNLSHTTAYTINGNGTTNGGSKIYAYSDDTHTTPLTSNQKASIKIIRRSVTGLSSDPSHINYFDINETGQSPGNGWYRKEIFDNSGTVEINTKNNMILARPDDSFDADIRTNSPTGTGAAYRFHWFGSGIGNNGGSTPNESWHAIRRLNGIDIEKTIDGETYKVMEVDSSLSGTSVVDGFSSFNLVAATTTGSALPFVGTGGGSSNIYASGNDLEAAAAIAWTNGAGQQLVYAEFGDVENGNGRRFAIQPLGASELVVSAGGVSVYGVPIRIWPVEIFERRRTIPAVAYPTWQTITVSSGGDVTTTAGSLSPCTMQPKNNLPSSKEMHSIISEDKSFSPAQLKSLPVVSGQIQVTPTDDWWDILESGTIVRLNSSTGTEYVLRQTEASIGSTSLRVFNATTTFTDTIPLTNNSAQTFWSEGEQWFNIDTTTDYANFGENDAAAVDLRYRETDEFRWLQLRSQTGNTVDITRPAIVDSTTGNIALTGTHNHKADNPNVSFPGNQTYKQRTGASTYVNAAIVEDDYYDIDSSTTSDFTDGTKPSLTVSQSTEGYISGISLGSTGRITTGQKMLTIGATPDSYTPPTPTPAEQEDVWDTDDEWASDGFAGGLKEWPDHVTPRSAVINYNSPTIVNNSQSGIKYTRSVGHTKWRLEVEYPPMSAEDFQKFHAIAQAAHGQSTPFYFNLKHKDGNPILWKDFYDQNNSTTSPRIKDAIASGDTTMLVEGFNSNENDAFKRGEVFIDGNNENGYLHTSLSGTDANIYGEAKIRTPWPFRTDLTAGEKIYKNPSHAVVTLGSDNFEYSVDVNNYYYVNVAFDLDSWK